MKIYLIGYMASGKTTLGKELAGISGWPFVDLDEVFENRYKVSIGEFFDKYGEVLFRKLEREILLETGEMDDAIISAGGGTPCFSDNMDFMLKHGRSVFLDNPVEVLAGRLRGVRKKRPLLKDLQEWEMTDHVTRQLREREVFYRKADLIVQGPQFDASEILKKLQAG